MRDILSELFAESVVFLERKMAFIGTMISLLCRKGGWFIPMYGAGKLERGNLVEYKIAARLAFKAGKFHLVDELLDFGELEWKHAQYFRAQIEWHWLTNIFWLWPAPPPRADIRNSYQRFLGQTQQQKN